MALPRGGKHSPSKQTIEAKERQAQALQLRKAGASFAAIGRQLGYTNASGAYKACKAAMAEIIRQPAQELIDLEVERLDALMLGLWQRATTGGDIFAVDRVLAIMARRAKLLGLDAPTKKEISGEWVMRTAAEDAAARYGLDPAEVLAQAEAIVRTISAEQ